MPTLPEIKIDHLLKGMENECVARPEGRVYEVAGLTVKSVGPHISIGDMAWIETESLQGAKRIPCEVVGFRDRFVLLMPVERLGGIRPGARVVPGGRMSVSAGYSMLGRVVDGLGRPIDNGPEIYDVQAVDIDRAAPPPMSRERLTQVFSTGVRSIDGLLTCAKGQRVGIFAGSGVGKSVLLGSLARNSCATVNVIALIGERGREVRDFVENALGPEGLAKSVVVVVTSDESPLIRSKGASTAMAIAEYFRDRGEHVLLLMDSVTRFAMAQREIGLAVGEPPTTKGYPPSVFGLLARLLERAGASDKGSITAFFTVLVEADDMNDPIADSVRSILDGHIVLSRALAEHNHYPSIDVLMSISRLMSEVTQPRHRELAGKMRSLISTYRKAEDLINIGAYVAGSNPKIDEALKKIDTINAFLRQGQNLSVEWPRVLQELETAVK
ncbi:MAG: EscN/YscN/HrcN family type III secretion system ATPase [Lentisphaerae bacterium GWF2_57_35]|nr:MAG: EscN/YscN/HrcN family type III secretion system ATPase [Lentisphaerae bacterium GWF2_57_35]